MILQVMDQDRWTVTHAQSSLSIQASPNAGAQAGNGKVNVNVNVYGANRNNGGTVVQKPKLMKDASNNCDNKLRYDDDNEIDDDDYGSSKSVETEDSSD